MRALITIAAIVFLSGCSFLMPWNQDLTVNAKPDEAQIFINGEAEGKGKITTSVPRNEPSEILVTHPDYANTNRRVGTTLSATGTADLVGGYILLLPAIGLLSPGAWHLEQDTMTIVLEE
jgi:hypothetical protein